jgi:hypothetical protein
MELLDSVVKVLRRQFLGTAARDPHIIGTRIAKKLKLYQELYRCVTLKIWLKQLAQKGR